MSDTFLRDGKELTDSDVGRLFRTRKGYEVVLQRNGESGSHPFTYHITGMGGFQVQPNGYHKPFGGGLSDFDLVARVEDEPVRRNCIPLIESVKESNPKDAVGVRKIPMSCVSMPVMMELAAGMMEGARKYGRHNYRVIGVRASVYFDAAMRHLTAWWEGEDIDAASGLSHISKAMSTLHVLRDAMIRGKMVDDRPPGTSGFIAALNEVASDICDRFPDAKEPFLAQGPPDQYVA